MKKIVMLATIVLSTVFMASARNNVTYSDAVLPANAKAILSQHFKSKVNHVKVDKGVLGGTEYEVILQNGTEVDFKGDGSLKEVDAGKNAVPQGLVLQPIKTYIKNNYGNKKIVQLEVKDKGYEIELADGKELVFDRAGNFVREDR